MSEVMGLAPDDGALRIFIKTEGLLDLGHLAKFFQRLDVITRRAAGRKGWREPTIRVSQLATGSIELKVQIEGLRVAKKSYLATLAGLAIAVAALLKSDAPSAKACDALLSSDNATVIMIEGGGISEQITTSDIEPAVERIASAAQSSPPSPTGEGPVLLTGPQDGFVRSIDGEDWVELKDRPGLLLLIKDERGVGQSTLEHRANYTLDGEAHIAPRGAGSFFILRRAMKLG